MNKDWIFSDEKNTHIHKDLMPKLVKKIGTEGTKIIITIVANGGIMKEQSLLESSSDGIEHNRKLVNEVVKSGLIKRIGDRVELIEGVLDDIMV